MKAKQIIKQARQKLSEFERKNGFSIEELSDVEMLSIEYRQATGKCMFHQLKMA